MNAVYVSWNKATVHVDGLSPFRLICTPVWNTRDSDNGPYACIWEIRNHKHSSCRQHVRIATASRCQGPRYEGTRHTFIAERQWEKPFL
jgi:hypothetical protein